MFKKVAKNFPFFTSLCVVFGAIFYLYLAFSKLYFNIFRYIKTFSKIKLCILLRHIVLHHLFSIFSIYFYF